ncbi:MAG: rhomboid family intramembrane serine protease [Bacteroidota bacterium]
MSGQGNYPDLDKRGLAFDSFKMPLYFIFIIFLIHFVQVFTPLDFKSLGIFPRRIEGLWGVFLAPLIHADFAHLMSNSVPFMVLGTIIFHFYRSIAAQTYLLIHILTGLAVWILGRSVFHIGASGVVYGMVAFIFFTGIFRRNVRSIVLALIVTFLYSGMFLGVLPNQEGISWESHLLGGIVGIFAAYLFRDTFEKEEQQDVFATEEEGSSQFFLPRDTFNLTKEEKKRAQLPEFPDWFTSKTWDKPEN